VYGSGSLSCEDACDATFRPSSGLVVIRAHPGAGSHFTQWTGACRGTRVTCFVDSGVGVHVNAFFPRTPSHHPLRLRRVSQWTRGID